ncbi:hypothetical protein ACFWP7_15595 [Streptomyces sp. NPDC058470]|uniref:hypothetical protein n=1 Tax=Streptomyces sp. NPDC058470 TaxID=3346515 RepID=UPI0036571034
MTPSAGSCALCSPPGTLASYASHRPEGRDPVVYERDWKHPDALRREITAVRETLVFLARALQRVADVSDLIDLPVLRATEAPAAPGQIGPPPAD